MKRVLMYGVGLALLIGVVGCGSAGIEEGAPRGDLKPAAQIDPNMTKPGGNFGAAAAGKAAAKNAEQAKIDGANAPAPEKK